MESNAFKTVLNDLATPSYVFDLDKLKERMDLIKEILGDRAVPCYAMKANPFLIKPMNDYTEKYEVCSPGEYEICYRAGIDPEKIVVSGVNKTYESMTRIMDISGGKGIFTIESMEHYDILSKVCKEQDKKIKVILRLSSGNQFGMDKENLEKVLVKAKDDDGMEVYGIHFYSGTQKKLKKVEKELANLEEYAIYIRDTYGITLKELEYGPGLSVTYFETDTPIDAREQLEGLKELLDRITAYEHITIEMGRFIATCCGYYFTKVMDVKNTEDINYAIVDGGIHQLNYYGQIMGMKRPHLTLVNADGTVNEEEQNLPWNICGSLCTVNDVILKGAMFPMLSKGDCIIFENCGAYSVTEGMALFLSRELPQILFYSEKDGFTVAREMKETNLINS
ncbi:MAG: alanine racemase [Lachnospiraceae bacterium]|nr:alanine racemase [Lachnospiraceae bacterium]